LFIAAILATGIAAVLLAAGYHLNGVTVLVNNASAANLSSVEVRFAGGTNPLPRLGAGATFKSKVRPCRESALMLAFVDVDGRAHATEVDVYLEPGYGGSIEITVGRNAQVTWSNKSTTRWFLP
jgi:hypothetical protein